ncbi:hypothetical protein VQ643_09990 [Pseudomonas sp. F1_0610]|uniref:hypothetical protein n=1 Tax=Pseudomonas sp. F1_0610 TaxID=3114284 RepID=UPI0039C2FFFF
MRKQLLLSLLISTSALLTACEKEAPAKQQPPMSAAVPQQSTSTAEVDTGTQQTIEHLNQALGTSPKNDTSAWEKTKDTSNEAWNKTKEASSNAWEKTKEATENTINKLKN